MAATGAGKTMDKEKKYDRQLRLWGDHGQAALEASRVCLVNVTATGTETLKNLILPGIGWFTIIDGGKVTGEDVGNNFFLERDSIGKSRAEVATECLLELNSDVRGDFIDENPEHLLEANPEFFRSFSCVIAAQMPERTLLSLASVLWNYGIPLLVCRSYGLIGYMRVVVKEHTVIESHPDNAHSDLRLDRPFPALAAYVDAVDMDSLSKKDHSHTPFPVILLKNLIQWRKEHEGNMPKNYKEKGVFKEMVRKGMWENEEGPGEPEENFEEAIRHTNTALVPTRIPSEIQTLFEDEGCRNLNAESSDFFVMTKALKEFAENEGKGALPVRGAIPDMFADSERYIQLQNIYRDQAKQDASVVASRVTQILSSIGRPSHCISEEAIRLFCRNAAFLRVVRTRSLEEEYNPEKACVNEMGVQLENPDSEITLYIMLRAVDKFQQQYGRYPGYYDDQVEADIPKLKACMCGLLQEWSLSPYIKDEYVHEMCRYGGSELHSVAAFMGGAAAQEVIKLVTKQFVPFNNTYIYNAMNSSSATYTL
ncbi:NEDD8-activating enzyme E1 regulatory subunit-like [Branchiostoma floridae]|uniref:NEDD8-activating enzyme E1 regulatory subunit n=1 Tax=Branchiostoma floridae TaxID=7739 RepID=A0A9J7LB48_BRAFL|nr:NEDD8-activating enzyme E1 regulatory subunit-like [Branchiostoma floridae]